LTPSPFQYSNRLLLKVRSNVNAKDNEGKTSLHHGDADKGKDAVSKKESLKRGNVITTIIKSIAFLGGIALLGFLLKKYLASEVAQEFVSEKTNSLGSFSSATNVPKVLAESVSGKLR
jgi:hypothetical protein